MLHKSKGKYRWQNKATYSTEWSLSPVIKAYLEQLLKNKDKAGFGIPHYYCNLQAKIEGFDKYDWNTDIDLNAAHQLRVKDIEELIWTFSDNEPDILSYGLEYGYGSEGVICLNEKARDDYHKDIKEWSARKQAGYELFGKIYTTLDW